MLLTLRPHHILCRLGFQGYGYSPEFIDTWYRVLDQINSGKVKTLSLQTKPDVFCHHCPHFEGECSTGHPGLRGQKSEERDQRVLRALRLKPGRPYAVKEIDERIAALLPEEFSAICRNCEWQPHGFCLRGHARLRLISLGLQAN